MGTKPKEIDVLIIKKDKGRVIRKNIVRANKQKFEEVKGMCDALRELMKDEIEAEATEKRINALTLALSKADRVADIIKVAEDHDYQQKLFKEFGL
mgnify:CR=1 FL=1